MGCGKSFQSSPYLKRKTNYCSLNCYRNTTRQKELRNCKVCGQKFWAIKPQIVNGFGFFCSRECQHKTYPQKVEKVCLQCHKNYYVPPSWAKRGNYCSKKCHDDSMRDYVKSVCKKCGKVFELPRSDLNRGRGNFCNYRCYLTYRGPSTLEEKMERVLSLAGIKFEREIKFKRFHVDFLLRDSKTIIECDGEYWHLNPKIQERDKRKDKLLKGLGYRVIRFSGSTINKLAEKQLAIRVRSLTYL
jgi:very-short-patch-repair endonuclease